MYEWKQKDVQNKRVHFFKFNNIIVGKVQKFIHDNAFMPMMIVISNDSNDA